jgi:hypothetical protein
MITFIVKLLVVAIAHVTTGVWLYHGRIQNRHAIFHSDLIVFALPALVALCVYAYLIRQEVTSNVGTSRPTIVSLSLALIPTVLSSLIFLYVAFNRYGT